MARLRDGNNRYGENVTELSTTLEEVVERVEALEAEVEVLLKAPRPGRKATPMVAPDQPGVCGLDPDCDSSKCEKTSVYRYQQGCRGNNCVDIYREYYQNYRNKGSNGNGSA